METNEPVTPGTWQNNINPHLLRRLINPVIHPGVIRLSLAEPILSRVQRMAGQLPMLDSVKQRSGVSDAAVPRLPVVAAQSSPKGGSALLETQAQMSNAAPLSPPARIAEKRLEMPLETHSGQAAPGFEAEKAGRPLISPSNGDLMAGQTPADPTQTKGLPLVKVPLPAQTLPRAVQGISMGPVSTLPVQPGKAADSSPLPVVWAQKTHRADPVPDDEIGPALESGGGPSPEMHAGQSLPVIPVTVSRAGTGPGPVTSVLPLVHVQRKAQGAASRGEGLPVVSAEISSLAAYRSFGTGQAGQTPISGTSIGRAVSPEIPALSYPETRTRRAAPGAAGQASPAPAPLIQRETSNLSTSTLIQTNPPGATNSVESAVQSAAAALGEVDVDELAEKVMKKIATEMKIERERRGWQP